MKQDTLIVIDMQNDFLTGSLANPDGEKLIEPIKEKIENFNGKIIFTQDTHTEKYLDTNEGKHLPIKHCIRNTLGWGIPMPLVDIGAKKYALFFNKPTFGALELYKELPEEGDIYICGVCTDICVVSNALILKAQLSEREIYVLKDLCAGTTKENHEAALQTMRSCQINVI